MGRGLARPHLANRDALRFFAAGKLHPTRYGKPHRMVRSARHLVVSRRPRQRRAIAHFSRFMALRSASVVFSIVAACMGGNFGCDCFCACRRGGELRQFRRRGHRRGDCRTIHIGFGLAADCRAIGCHSDRQLLAGAARFLPWPLDLARSCHRSRRGARRRRSPRQRSGRAGGGWTQLGLRSRVCDHGARA